MLSIGDFDLHLLSDGPYLLDAGNVFGIIPKVLWEKRLHQRNITVDAHNRIPVGVNSLLARTRHNGRDLNILIETGIGNKLTEKMARPFEPKAQLLNSLHAAGLAPEDVHMVINTHLHFDHCGWNTIYKEGRPTATFPNATYYVQRGEWEHAQLQTERDRVSYISDNYNPLLDAGKMRLLDGDAHILPGLSVQVFPGHTRDMQAVLIGEAAHANPKASADSRPSAASSAPFRTACYISDLIPTQFHLDLPWGLAFDLFPLDTIASKKRFYARAIPENWLVIFTHDHTSPFATVAQTPEGRITSSPVDC